LPAAEWLIADRGYDADWFRAALEDKGSCRPALGNLREVSLSAVQGSLTQRPRLAPLVSVIFSYSMHNMWIALWVGAHMLL
jgi:hypothetical protein